jgi:hypothetical protein
VVIEGRKIGTHAAWHILNALALFLLLRASLEGGPGSVARTEMPPLSDEPFEPIGNEPVEPRMEEKPAGFIPAEPRDEKPAGFIPAADVPAPKPLSERVEAITPAESEEAAKTDDKETSDDKKSETFFPA